MSNTDFDPDKYLGKSGDDFDPDAYLPKGAGTGVSEKKEPRTSIGTEELKGAATGGAVAGFFTPELTMGLGKGAQYLGKGLQLAPNPLLKGGGRVLEALGTGAETFGRQMKAAPVLTRRVAPAALGATGGLVGETAGQAVEFLGYPGLPAEGARLVGGLAVPGTVGIARTGSRYGNILLDAAKRYTSGEPTAQQISAAEKQQIAALVEKLRGQAPESEASIRIYQELENAISRIEGRAAQDVRRLEQAPSRVEASDVARRAQTQSSLEKIGDVTAKESDIGERARNLVVKAQEAFEEARNTPYAAARQEVLNIANQKQAAGQFIEGTKAFQDLEKFLQQKVLAGRVGLEQPMATATERGVVNAYENVLNAVRSRRVAIGTSADAGAPQLAAELKQKGLRVIERVDPNTNVTIYEREFPTAFEAIDDLRRRVAQAAKFGEPVSGYEALSASNAKDLYGKLSKIQEEFVGEGPFKTMQSIYEQGTAALQGYGGKAGTKYAGIDFADPTRFKTNPKQLVNEAFGSRQGVDDLIRLSNNNVKEVEALASDYVASSIAGKNSKAVDAFINQKKIQDMLSHPSLANLKNKLDTYAARLRADEVAGERGKATVAKIGERKAAISQETERLVSDIRGDKFPVARIKQLITSGSPKQWADVAPYIAQTPQGKLDLLNAVRETVAEAASKNPTTAVRVWKENISPGLATTGIPKAAIDRIGQQLDDVARYAAEPVKLDTMNKIIGGFIRYYAAPSAGAYAGGLIGEGR